MPALAGAILLAAVVSWAGLAAARSLYAREKCLAAWLYFVEKAGRDIGFGLSSLPELAAQMTHPRLSAFREHMKKEYSPFCGRDFADVWRDAADRLELPERDRELISSIGGILGKYDAESQAKGLEIVRLKLSDSLKEASRAKASHARVYGALGIAGGLAVIIIFAL